MARSSTVPIQYPRKVFRNVGGQANVYLFNDRVAICPGKDCQSYEDVPINYLIAVWYPLGFQVHPFHIL